MGKLDNSSSSSSSSSDKSSSKSSNSLGSGSSGGGSLTSSSSSSTSSSKTSNTSKSSESKAYVNQSIANAEKNGGGGSSGGGLSSSGGGSVKNTASSMSLAGDPGSRSSYSADKIGASLSYEGGSSKNAPLTSSEKAAIREALTSSTSFSNPGPGASLEQLQNMIQMFGPGEQVWAPPIGGAQLPSGPIQPDSMNPMDYGYGYGLDAAAPGWNPMQFLEDAMAEGAKRRAERAAEGYEADPNAIIDLNALLWDLNAPYRERVEAAGGKPFEGAVDWDGIWGALQGEDAATRDAILREARLRAASDAPDTGAQWAELMDFATRDARLPARPDLGHGELLQQMASADEIAAAAAAEAAKYGKVGDQIGQTMGGIDALLTAYAPDAMPPLPRPRPGYAPSSMDIAAMEAEGREPIEVTVPYGPEDALHLPGQVEGALPQHPGGPETKEPTVWDNVVDMGGKVLENTTLGSVAKGLFPDLWYGAGEAIKGLQGGLGAPQSNRPGDAFWEFQHQGSLSSPGEDYGNYGGSGVPVVPPPVTPPFPDVNHNGIDDRLEGGTLNEYDRFGQVVFPDLPPYNPGRDPEWLYFRKRAGLRDGGIVGYADGGMVPPEPLNMQDPRVEVIAKAEDALENALEGQPEPDDEADVAAFVEMFGEGALANLKENVMAGMKMRPRRSGVAGNGKGRMVQGPGGPRDDMVPAVVDGNQPVNLSNGEFVVPADAVAAAGDGDPMAGAAALTELSDRLAARPKAA